MEEIFFKNYLSKKQKMISIGKDGWGKRVRLNIMTPSLAYGHIVHLKMPTHQNNLKSFTSRKTS